MVNIIMFFSGTAMILGSVILYFIDFFRKNEVSVKVEHEVKSEDVNIQTVVQPTIQTIEPTGIDVIDTLEMKALEGIKTEIKPIQIKEVRPRKPMHPKKIKKQIVQKIKKTKPKKVKKEENPLVDPAIYEKKDESVNHETVKSSDAVLREKAKEISEKIEERANP